MSRRSQPVGNEISRRLRNGGRSGIWGRAVRPDPLNGLEHLFNDIDCARAHADDHWGGAGELETLDIELGISQSENGCGVGQLGVSRHSFGLQGGLDVIQRIESLDLTRDPAFEPGGVE